MPLEPLPSSHDSTRNELHRVATHILARRRSDVSGRFGLRASPCGFSTPAFGDAPEVIRISGTTLVCEVGGECRHMPIHGSTLAELASFADVHLGRAFDCGTDAPDVGDPDVPLDVDASAATLIAGWYDLAWEVLDEVMAGLPRSAAPVAIQLWPEHFDAGTNIGLASGERVNLGFSPGDDFEAEPYAYVGPWSALRPGDRDFWNAPFGAVLRRSDIEDSSAPASVCADFLRAGLHYLAEPGGA